jgi:ATP-dependent exoDNAse (exonuclease V) alpha subunit
MALYRLEAKIISRQSRGKSVIASAAYQSGNILHKAAYRSGTQLKDERTQATYNYRARSQEVVHSEILAPKNGPLWLQNAAPYDKEDGHKQRALRERLWNTIEQVEKRKDSQLAREFVLTLARELTLEQQVELVRGWCQAEFISKGLVVDFSVHKSKTGQNPHAHVLCTTRPVEGQGFGKKPSTAGKFNGRGSVGVGAKSDLEAWRDSWEKHENSALEKAGRPERVDHRSLKDRGIDRIPQPKIGVAAMGMKRRGLDPERFQLVRFVKALNEMRPFTRAIEKFGEIRQTGMGRTWWERSMNFMSQARHAVRESAVDSWRLMLDAHRRSTEHLPSIKNGPDISR